MPRISQASSPSSVMPRRLQRLSGNPERSAKAYFLDSQAKPAAIARLATPARRRPSLAPGRLTAGDSAQSASVAISVPRRQPSAHQSRGPPRNSAVARAAAKESQIGAQRRQRRPAGGGGSS